MKTTTCLVASLSILWGTVNTAAIAGQPEQFSQSPICSYFNQGRIGFGLAGEYIHSDTSLKTQPDRALGEIGSTQSQIGKKLQVSPFIELGVQIEKNYYLGLVLSWRYSGVKNTSRVPIRQNNFFSHEFKINHYTDIMVKPGYKFTPRTMAYGLIGPTIANWNHTSSQLLGEDIVNKFTVDKTSLGLGLGFGFEHAFEEKFVFSVDYTHHFLKTESTKQLMNYQEVTAFGNRDRSGNLTKRVQPSYGVLAARFTVFFNL